MSYRIVYLSLSFDRMIYTCEYLNPLSGIGIRRETRVNSSGLHGLRLR